MEELTTVTSDLATILLKRIAYLVLFGCLQQVGLVVNKDVIAFKSNVARGRWAGIIVEIICRRFVRRAIYCYLPRLPRLQERSETLNISSFW